MVGIFTDLRRCRLQTNFFKRLIFVNKTWPNDHRIGCKSPFNLLEFLERDIDLKKELEEF